MNNRTPIIAGNWKMNKNLDEANALVEEILVYLNEVSKLSSKVVLIPSFPFLSSINTIIEPIHQVFLGAQNCHQADSGAFTGEVCAEMLRSLNVSYVLVGHSERRQYFNETETVLAQKIKQCLKNNLFPIYCIGETLAERESGEFFNVLESQLFNALQGLQAIEVENKLVIAYEPVWAIGTGVTASSSQAQEVHAFIRNWMVNYWSKETAEIIPILYGGSVNAGNSIDLFSKPDIDGGLIGGASLKARDFVDIIKAAQA